MCRVFGLLLIVALASASLSRPALAFKQFQDQWYEIYLTDHEDEDYVKLVRKKVKCYVCHQGKKKSDCNPYGACFVGLLLKEDKEDVEKIAGALAEVGKNRSNPKDDKSPTFDELVAQSKLPGGELEELKKPVENKEIPAPCGGG